nr:probable uridine nucleosidase 1 isoform X2 [Zootoca vivipara]
MKKLLLLDVDCGVDDAQAIMMALASPNVEVLGITCCYGNSILENICKNVFRVLHICNKLEVSLVATGPLTNLALAVKMDPTFPKKLKNVFIMGGNTEARGNTTVCGEFNFATDPEAAYIVLNEYTCPTYIASWEFTCSCPLSWEFYHEWVNQKTEKAMFVKKIFAHSFEFSKILGENPGEKEWRSGFVPCDSYAMAAAIEDDFLTEYTAIGVSVELKGSLTRGMMVVDWSNKLNKENKAFLMKNCDLGKFRSLLLAAVK